MNELLLLVQVDDATGETLQHTAQRILAAGARNVQILASTTKKGRPGQVCLIDVPAECEDEVALLLGTELGVWGYRVLEAKHRHFDIISEEHRVRVNAGGQRISQIVRCKYIRKNDRLLAVKAEHDDLVRLQQALMECRVIAALRTLRALIEAAAIGAGEGSELEVEV
jgi:uncharacterized protein (DUF111 family)